MPNPPLHSHRKDNPELNNKGYSFNMVFIKGRHTKSEQKSLACISFLHAS